MSIARRIAPLTGTEAMRQLKAALIEANEIHTTKDQKRVFLENVLVASEFHDGVADEAAMLALNTTAERGCWPMDMCWRVDSGTVWLCVADHGADLVDWIEFTGGGGGGGMTNPMTTAGDIIIGGTAGAPTRLGVGTDGYVLKLVAGVPAWAAESGGGGGSDFLTVQVFS
jgi:hypothetical protein